MKSYDPLNYLEDDEHQKYDPALKSMAPRPRMEYTPPVTSGTNVVEPPQVEAPQMPEQSAGPKMPGWRTADDARESTRTALNADEDLKRVISEKPQLQRAKGWKGALQTVGEMFLNPAVIHPNYTRQMDEYEQNVGVAESRAKIAANQADQQRRQAIAEAQGEHYGEQSETERRRQADIDRKAGMPEYMPISEYGGVFNKTAGEVAVAPRVRPPTPVRPPAPHVQGVTDAGGNYRTVIVDPVTKEQTIVEGGKIGRPVRPAGGAGGQASQRDFRVIENNKNNAMLKAKVAAQREEAKIKANKDFLVTPEQKQEEIAKVWANYNDQMEQIQNGYESNILAGGGSIAPRGGTPPPPPPPAAKTINQTTLPDGRVVTVGSEVKLKNGSTVKIKAINSDGTFDY